MPDETFFDPIPPGDSWYHLTLDGMKRSYLVHVPVERKSNYLPVVVFLHGMGGTPEWAANETSWSQKSDQEGFLAVYPLGTTPLPNKPAKFLTNPAGWFDGSPRMPDPMKVSADVGFLTAMCDKLVHDYPIDTERVYLSGFSNGAGMTFRLASEQPNRFAAIAPVAGHCSIDPALRLPRKIPTLFMVGTEDPVMPIAGGIIKTFWDVQEDRIAIGESLRRWSEALQIPPVTPNLINPEVTAPLIELMNPLNSYFQAWYIEGLGHHWPGGRGWLGEKLGGRHFATISATDIIWDFFRNRQLSEWVF